MTVSIALRSELPVQSKLSVATPHSLTAFGPKGGGGMVGDVRNGGMEHFGWVLELGALEEKDERLEHRA